MAHTNNYSEPQFYVDGKSLLKEGGSYIRNFTVDDKHVYGHSLLKLFEETIVAFKLSYRETSPIFKRKYAEDARLALDKAEVKLDLVRDIGILPIKQHILLFQHLGSISEQLNKWLNSLEKKS